MKNIYVICKKELNSYFYSWIAYIILGVFAVMFGYLFWNIVWAFAFYSAQSQAQGGMRMNINEQIIPPLLGNINVLGLILVPLISMRLFAKEKENGTIELLLTSPVSDWQIILGKWLAAVILYAGMLALAGLNFLLLAAYGTPDWKPIVIGLLGLLLQESGLLAIGMFFSSLTRNQIIAFVSAAGVCLLLRVMNWTSTFESAIWAQVLAYLSIVSHFESFSKGVLDTKDVIFYCSVIFLGLFLTSRSLESLRWRS